MKRTKRNPAARAYFRAFYDGNRLNFGLTALLTLLGIPVTLSRSEEHTSELQSQR